MKHTLRSGKELEINLAPFEDGKTLYQAVCEEMRGLDMDPEAEMDTNFFKNILFTGLSSKKIEAALWKCFGRAHYDGCKITKDTFEPISAREDYLEICFLVAEENIRPFAKNLYALWSDIMQRVQPSTPK